MEIDSASVAIGVVVGAALCPWLLTLGADDKQRRRADLAEDTFTAILLGIFAGLIALVVVNALNGRSPF